MLVTSISLVWSSREIAAPKKKICLGNLKVQSLKEKNKGFEFKSLIYITMKLLPEKKIGILFQ